MKKVFEGSIKVNKPIEKVFKYYTDREKAPSYLSHVESYEKISVNSEGIGSKYQVTFKSGSKMIEELVEFLPNEKYISKGTGKNTNLFVEALFNGNENYSELNINVDIKYKGIIMIFSPLLNAVIKSTLNHDIKELKKCLMRL